MAIARPDSTIAGDKSSETTCPLSEKEANNRHAQVRIADISCTLSSV